MKPRFLPFLTLILLFSSGLSAQKLDGAWKCHDETREGRKANLKLLMNKDGTFGLDIGNDGSVDIKGTYTIEGDKMTIYDTTGEEACDTKQKGVYRIQWTKKAFTMVTLSEECPNRGGPIGEEIVFSRM